MMTFIFSQIEAVTKFADSSDGKSDRWLLIVLATVGFGCVCMAGRWIVGRFERLSDKHETSMENHAKTVGEFCNAAHKVNQELAVSLNRNTDALEDGIEERRKLREALENLQRKL
jgi:hypothetical protein